MAHDAPQPEHRSRAKQISLIAVAVLIMAIISAALWSVISSRSGQTPTAGATAPTPTILPEGVNSPAAINEPTQSVGAIEDLLGGSAQASDQGHLEFVDDAGDVVRELIYQRLEPREGGRVEVTKPEGWLHLKTGAIAHLESAQGSLLQPAGRSEPVSGRFWGDVRVQVYPHDPRTDADPSSAVASFILTTDSLSFDTTMGELRTADPVHVVAPGVDLRFTGFTLVMDEVQDRLALFRTDSAGVAVIHPEALTKQNTSNDPSKNSADSSTVAARDLLQTLYHASLTDAVEIRSIQGAATAQRLDLWTRLIDHKLTARTIAGLRSLNPASEKSTDQASNAHKDAGEQTITLTWSKALVVEPMDKAPDELAHEDARIRLSAPNSGTVALSDPTGLRTTQSVGLEVALASRVVTWSGVGPRSVSLRVENSFEAVAGRLVVDLASGDASFPGPGVIRKRSAARAVGLDRPDTPPEITWRDHADLSLAHSAAGVDFAAKLFLKSAIFVGAADASGAFGSLRGDQIQTTFALDRAGDTALSRAVVTGSARVDSGAQGVLTARRLDIEFDLNDPAGEAPAVATAQGDVRAQRQGSTLRADLAEAHFTRSDAGGLVIDSFTADLGVVANTVDGVRATGRSLRSKPDTGVFNLAGDPAHITLGANTISGVSMRLDQTARSLTVFGAGVLKQDEPNAALGYQSMRLTWADSMKFDDLAGLAVFQGECELTANASDLASDVLTAGRIEVNTQPYSLRQNAGANDPKILFATASGGSDPANLSDLARLESRRYIHDADVDGGLRLTRLVYLDGPLIEADVVNDELRVPKPGRLLVENRSAETDSQSVKDGRGTTLIEWDGSFKLQRRSGMTEFRRQVRVRHRPLGAPKVTELECERLELSFDPNTDDRSSAGGDSGLLWAQAQGAVYVAQGQRQVIADRLLFDNSLGFAELTAWPGNVVTLFDARTPTPLTGELMRWDLLRDRVDWKGARPVSAPN